MIPRGHHDLGDWGPEFKYRRSDQRHSAQLINRVFLKCPGALTSHFKNSWSGALIFLQADMPVLAVEAAIQAKPTG